MIANILFLIRSRWDGINIKSLIFSFVMKKHRERKIVGEVPGYGNMGNENFLSLVFPFTLKIIIVSGLL